MLVLQVENQDASALVHALFLSFFVLEVSVSFLLVGDTRGVHLYIGLSFMTAMTQVSTPGPMARTWPRPIKKHISDRREEGCNAGTQTGTGVIDNAVAIDTFKHSLLNTIEKRSENKNA